MVGNIMGRGCELVGALSETLGVGGLSLCGHCQQH